MKNLSSMGLKTESGKLWALDQTLLPHEEKWIECHSPQDMAALIQRLAVRGAPLIGVAAGLALAQYAENGASPQELRTAAELLRNARPTAVNLMAAVDQIVLKTKDLTVAGIVQRAEEFFEEDVRLCEAMATHGAELIQDGDSILTHCNAGALATVGIGTAVGVIRKAFEQKKKIHVYVDETRPLLQGARLTTWELSKLGIPFTLIADNMAGFLMQQKKIQKIFVGADRIAANGDAANKIGTYSLATLAHAHGIPFYVVAPRTTVDQSCAEGAAIPIEERGPHEVIGPHGLRDARVYNPAFDVTPKRLITKIILDSGFFTPTL